MDRLSRFIKVYERLQYESVLTELKCGRKVSHWMWYVFPQLRGLARSRKAYVFGIADPDEARAYLNHPILGARLIACCEAVLAHTDKSATAIFGDVDAVKLRSSMTLFAIVSGENSAFGRVLRQFYQGNPDPMTVGLVTGRIIDATHLKYRAAFVS